MIDTRDLCKGFGGRVAVDRVTLHVSRGECLGVCGPSGCGKSTLLRLIAGFEEPDVGEVLISGAAVSRPGRVAPPYGRSVAMVFQDLALWPHMTVRKNLEFVMNHGPIGPDPRKERDPRIDQALEQVALPVECHRRYPHELSGGERQRLALARALIQKHEILLLDEPLSSLDRALRDRMIRLLKEKIETSGVTAILVTHNHEEVATLATRTCHMSNGRLVEEG